jgi:hypothetical protein
MGEALYLVVGGLKHEHALRLMTASRRTTEAHLGHQAGGAGSRSAVGAPGIGDSTAPTAGEYQSFLDNVIAQFGRA